MRENRWNKTVVMLRNHVQWKEVTEELGVTKVTLNAWRKSGDPNKNQVIDEAVEEIVKKKRIKEFS